MDNSNLIAWGVAIFTFLAMFIKIPKLEINVWSWVLKTLGKLLNADITEKVSKIEKDLDNHIREDERYKMTQCREQILLFNTSLLRQQHFTKEYFDEILRNIDVYEKYCKEHPNYENNRAEMAISNIKKNYMKCADDADTTHNFLNG